MNTQRQNTLWRQIVTAYRTRSHPEQLLMPVDELIRSLWLFASTREILGLLQLAAKEGQIRCSSPTEGLAFTVLEDSPVAVWSG